MSKTIVVVPDPVASFSYSKSTSCSGSQIKFINTSSNATTYFWDFQDGTTSTDSSPTHTFTAGGTYKVKLKVSNGVCEDSIKQSIKVTSTPSASFEIVPSALCLGQPLTIHNLSSGGKQYRWYFGDGTDTVITRTPRHTYGLPGRYLITLIAVLGTCTDTVSDSVIVYPVPQALFSQNKDSICAGDSVAFLNTSTNALSYHWSFGDGNTSILQNPVHQFLLPGRYDVSLTATNTICVDSVKTKVTVLAAPQASFVASSDSLCIHSQILFTNTSQFATSYRWDFGDGSALSFVENPTHIFLSAGSFHVKLVSIGEGCRDSITQTIQIISRPISIFSVQQSLACENDDVVFTNNSQLLF